MYGTNYGWFFHFFCNTFFNLLHQHGVYFR